MKLLFGGYPLIFINHGLVSSGVDIKIHTKTTMKITLVSWLQRRLNRSNQLVIFTRWWLVQATSRVSWPFASSFEPLPGFRRHFQKWRGFLRWKLQWNIEIGGVGDSLSLSTNPLFDREEVWMQVHANISSEYKVNTSDYRDCPLLNVPTNFCRRYPSNATVGFILEINGTIVRILEVNGPINKHFTGGSFLYESI